MNRRVLLPILLLAAISFVVVGCAPIVVYGYLPQDVRHWLNSSETLLGAVSAGLSVAVSMGLLAFVSYRIWIRLARKIFGEDVVSDIVRTWSGKSR